MARLEIDVIAKGEGTIAKVSSSLGSLQKRYEETVFDIKEFAAESLKLEGALKSLRAQFDAGAVSEAKFNAEASKIGRELATVRGAMGEAQSRAASLKATLDQTANSTRSLGNSSKQLQAYSNDFTSGIRSSNAVAVEFSRVIQDLPYGMQGVANNLQQLTQNWAYYTRAAKEAAAANGQVLTTGGLLRGALSSMASPANILTLAISAATAGWIAYEKWSRKAEKATADQKKKVDEAKNALNEYISTIIGYNRVTAEAVSNYSNEITKLDTLFAVLRSGTTTREQQTSALAELNKLYPDVFGNLTLERSLVDSTTEAYNKLRQSIIQTGIAQAAQKLSADEAEKYVRNLSAQAELFPQANREQQKYNELVKLRNILLNESEKYIGQQITLGGETVKVTKDNSYEITRLNALINKQYNIAKPLVDKYREYGKNIEDATGAMDMYNNIAAQNYNANEKQLGIIGELQAKLSNLEKERPFLKTAEDIRRNVQESEALKKQIEGLTGAVKKQSNEQNKVNKALEESAKRAAVADKEGRDKEIQAIQNWYKSRLELAKGNAAAITQLQENMRKEIDAVNAKWDAKELEDGRKMMEERQKRLAEQGKKNVEQIKKDAIAEINTSIVYQRRLFESRAQTLIRELNNETKIKEAQYKKQLQDEINSGKDIETAQKEHLQRMSDLQEGYYKRIEELTAKQREMNIVTSFDGSGVSIQLASITDQVRELSLAFENGAISEDVFIKKISDLSVQREQLSLLQSSVNGVSDAFGNLFGDALFDSENALANLGEAFKNLAKTAVSELAKIALRQALNLAVAKAGLASSLAAAKATSAALTATWSTPATLASIATAGGAAISGSAGVLSAITAVKGFSMAGFAKGGYTGNGGVNDIAGFVHGKEYVINAKSTRENLPLLKAINDGMNLSGLLRGTGVITPVPQVIKAGTQQVRVVVDGSIRNNEILLSNNRATRNEKRFGRG